ncbi:NACHT domain-containing protein [Favolaschia claudopus]|uniref:NACHT domain-containing protein n=1 Tax=Favolaschia claudopus TaxID=2862362 RepID=A0AAW0AKK8_9AGAR
MHSIPHTSNPPAWVIRNQQLLPPLAGDSQVISRDDSTSSVPSGHRPSRPSGSIVNPHQQFFQAVDVPIAQAMRENSNVYLFNIMGGTGGNGGQSRDGVAGQGGRGEGPIFNNNNYYDSSSEQAKQTALRELFKATVPDASYESAERYTYPLCHPGTRTKYLSRLNWWSHKNTSNTLWMHGPAGTGKSSIARSFCEELTAGHRLGANFFFKRGDSFRESAKGLFPTLAYQLAVRSTEFATAVAIVIQNDPSVGEDDQQEILRCILKTSQSLKFLVISRPEPQIHVVLAGEAVQDLDIEGSETDVRMFLIGEFKRIRTTHQICAPWPDNRVIEHLVHQSSGHFIYAIRFVDDQDAWPVKQLELIMKNFSSPEDSVSPFAALDSLYIQILKAVPRVYRSALLQILWILASEEFVFSIRTLAQFLKMEDTEVLLVLRRLHSILDVAVDLKARHKSFYDFLVNPARATDFAFTADAQNNLALKVLNWCSNLHEPKLTSFDELSRYVMLSELLVLN